MCPELCSLLRIGRKVEVRVPTQAAITEQSIFMVNLVILDRADLSASPKHKVNHGLFDQMGSPINQEFVSTY